MARNRKRAKERRDRRPQAVAGRSRLAAAGGGEGIPSPIEHATPDVELADAQLAMGRIEALDGEPASDPEPDPSGEGGDDGGAVIGAGFDGGDGAEPRAGSGA